MSRTYSLRKSKKILRHIYRLYTRRKKKLSTTQAQQMQEALRALQDAIIAKDREQADLLTKQAERLVLLHLNKSPFEKGRDFVLALAFALAVAIVIRQVWFEFYEIPSGSMRPTLKEQDRLVVSKTDFGINVPLTPEHFYFDSNLVQRGSIFIFTGQNMDIRDVDTLYFYVFPGKKQYIKRLIGKPGDILYFYGGLIYGIDQEGNDISSELQATRLQKIDHIPFIHFEGKPITPQSPVQGIFSPVVLYQMNMPVARLSLSSKNQPRGEMLIPQVTTYGDLWGMKNYAMARLLSGDEVKAFTGQDPAIIGDGVLYLELKHHPSLSPVELIRDEMGRVRPALSFTTSYIPLNEKQLHTLFEQLYTARFDVKNGIARRFGVPASQMQKNPFLPHLSNVPDGCYEFYEGKAYQVKWQGITLQLSPEHPLVQFSPERTQLLFNIGMEFDMRYAPQVKNQRLFPGRYAYFRDGDLYLMGAPILKKEDPALISFVAQEQAKVEPFIDLGPPLTPDGALNLSLIKQYGLTIPSGHYLGLGDNHAMSADSRDFGFIPQENMRGGPSFIFWPPGNRFGPPNQQPYPWINLPRIVVWILAAIAFTIWWTIHRKRNKLPLL